MSIERISSLYVATCDQCGTELPEMLTTHKEAVELMREAGWSTKKTDFGWENLCPECRED